jgi:hypothetical protein
MLPKTKHQLPYTKVSSSNIELRTGYNNPRSQIGQDENHLARPVRDSLGKRRGAPANACVQTQ